ncbi:hypothetical protein CgunFtcFv8_027814 [Champsocephalus gunnari]|uniref:Uncharacterized protein n=1 Tax=Champsocephalus gunnari TaxID=52237 RepID=A0AAN8EGQ4_CHAGU|nr:hypothetical protein CgunFtcFv8_027814 [Champsocephalus gunnari]
MDALHKISYFPPRYLGKGHTFDKDYVDIYYDHRKDRYQFFYSYDYYQTNSRSYCWIKKHRSESLYV